MAGKLKDVTDASFGKDVLQSDRTVLVDFWAEWCGPCRIVAPELEKLAAEFPAKIEVVQLNIEENPAMTDRYAVMSIPMLKVYRNGEVVKSIVGARPKEALVEALGDLLT